MFCQIIGYHYVLDLLPLLSLHLLCRNAALLLEILKRMKVGGQRFNGDGGQKTGHPAFVDHPHIWNNEMFPKSKIPSPITARLILGFQSRRSHCDCVQEGFYYVAYSTGFH